MADNFKYAKVRQEIINALKMDLLGPRDELEVLSESPKSAYIIGILAPNNENTDDSEYSNEQEVDTDIAYEEGNDFSPDTEDDNEPVHFATFSLPSSIGISFYVEKKTPFFNVDVSWGDYAKEKTTYKDKNDNDRERTAYRRIPVCETVKIDLKDIVKAKEYELKCDSNVHLHVSKIALKNAYFLVSVYVVNKRLNVESNLDSLMFQVHLKAYANENEKIFVAEHICRDLIETDEFYYEDRPIVGRGRGCAATWGRVENGKTDYVETDYIPQYEYPGVSPDLKGFDSHYFSMISMARPSDKTGILERLNTLADAYEEWIKKTLVSDAKMKDKSFANRVGNNTISQCQKALKRIREGISIIDKDDIAFDSFCFMNQVMYYQNSIKNFSKEYGKGIECSIKKFTDPRNGKNNFSWRPFQIAFILMNLAGIVNPDHSDRELVDLLYFPTGGGKTEAYLGLMAFVIANRRLRAKDNSEYNQDGGVTVILRYTLRLLTTQQRDRITKMVVAAELTRQKHPEKYGKEPISIGFWVGGQVTPNKFSDLEENSEDPGRSRRNYNLIYKQLLNCPYCGTPLKGEENFIVDLKKKSVEIYCSDKNCVFSKYGKKGTTIRTPIPVYLVDEEIYAKCPTIILSTVDKFAALPWEVKTNSLFGRVDRYCSRDGYVAIGVDHPKHKKTDCLPSATVVPVKPFLPPELIIQDELHLITGPLGTIYGGYETIIEDMCSYKRNGHKIKPKYVVSTATIKNAKDQTKCLYARNNTSQFPPNGFEIGDSFFIREMPISESPFRKYVGICAPGQSVKTTLLRTYAVILQKAFDLSKKEEYKDVIDPYYTLIGYYNSIRELGGTVRLMQDDIPKRINYLNRTYKMEGPRWLNKSNNIEITSRMSSYQIPEKLNQLETPYTKNGCLDSAIATNMIAVGMDVDRLGLMAVTGQPKQNSEYIQATSRIGRKYPGLVFTIYNPYRPRDLSHYENFTGYHSQLYRFVEGTTVTPFSARARDRDLHAIIISAIRLKYPELSENKAAGYIDYLTDDELAEIKAIIMDRLNIVKPLAKKDTEKEIDEFIDSWKQLASLPKRLLYYMYRLSGNNIRLMTDYNGLENNDSEKKTLRAMRDVENSSNMYYYEDE